MTEQLNRTTLPSDWYVPGVQYTLAFVLSVMFNSLQSHGLQHAKLPCPSPTTGTCSNTCLLSQWCHLTISSSVIPFSYLQSFPASWYFPKKLALCTKWPKYWNLSFSISPSNEYSWLISFRIDWFDFHAVQGTLKSLLQPWLRVKEFGVLQKLSHWLVM